MIERVVSLPEIALIAATRTAIGAGIGLLLARRLTEEQSKAAGWALLIAGTALSIPIGIEVLSKKSISSNGKHRPRAGGVKRLPVSGVDSEREIAAGITFSRACALRHQRTRGQGRVGAGL